MTTYISFFLGFTALSIGLFPCFRRAKSSYLSILRITVDEIFNSLENLCLFVEIKMPGCAIGNLFLQANQDKSQGNIAIYLKLVAKMIKLISFGNSTDSLFSSSYKSSFSFGNNLYRPCENLVLPIKCLSFIQEIIHFSYFLICSIGRY